jgi:hypothetical protein
VRAIGELLDGIRVIKLQGWESAFEERVGAIRGEELGVLKTMVRVMAVGFSLTLTAVPIFLPLLVFFVFIRQGNDLTAAIAFTTIALFNLLRFPFQNALPTGDG